MTRETKAPSWARFWTGLIVGVVGGVVVGAGGFEAARLLKPDQWTNVVGEWHRLPDQAVAGALPQVFTVPAKPWDYGATTRALPSTVTAQPSIVRVDVSDVTGPVGLSLAKPDGSGLISKEKPLPAAETPVSVYFRADGSQPVAVLVRNFDGKGAAGSLTVRAIKYAPEARLPKRALEKIVAAGLY